MTGARKRATYQDVIDAPEHKVAEIIDGELVVSPRPGIPHAGVESSIVMDVGAAFSRGRGGPGGWHILMEPELHFANGVDKDVLVPDVAGWRRERLPSLSNDPYFTLAPDWICEVLSKSTRSIDRMKKMPIYARAGVQYAWLVHPGFRTVEVFVLRDGQWIGTAVHRGDVVVRAEPFDAIELDLAQWWRDIPQPDRASEGEFAYEYGL
jgi:Uma2 family endonuclease